MLQGDFSVILEVYYRSVEVLSPLEPRLVLGECLVGARESEGAAVNVNVEVATSGLAGASSDDPCTSCLIPAQMQEHANP